LDKDAVARIVGRAMTDPEFSILLQKSPDDAAQTMKLTLSKKERSLLQSLPISRIIWISNVVGQQNQSDDVNPTEHLASNLGYIQQKRAVGMNEDISNVLDQQQQSGRRLLESLAELLDQQQQQKGRPTLENLAALLESPQHLLGVLSGWSGQKG